jgi:hypothetical protein
MRVIRGSQPGLLTGADTSFPVAGCSRGIGSTSGDAPHSSWRLGWRWSGATCHVARHMLYRLCEREPELSVLRSQLFELFWYHAQAQAQSSAEDLVCQPTATEMAQRRPPPQPSSPASACVFRILSRSPRSQGRPFQSCFLPSRGWTCRPWSIAVVNV